MSVNATDWQIWAANGGFDAFRPDRPKLGARLKRTPIDPANPDGVALVTIPHPGWYDGQAVRWSEDAIRAQRIAESEAKSQALLDLAIAKGWPARPSEMNPPGPHIRTGEIAAPLAGAATQPTRHDLIRQKLAADAERLNSGAQKQAAEIAEQQREIAALRKDRVLMHAYLADAQAGVTFHDKRAAGLEIDLSAALRALGTKDAQVRALAARNGALVLELEALRVKPPGTAKPDWAKLMGGKTGQQAAAPPPSPAPEPESKGDILRRAFAATRKGWSPGALLA